MFLSVDVLHHSYRRERIIRISLCESTGWQRVGRHPEP